jgi:hypothetical protein
LRRRFAIGLPANISPAVERKLRTKFPMGEIFGPGCRFTWQENSCSVTGRAKYSETSNCDGH